MSGKKVPLYLWPPNRAGHYILQLWFLFFFFFFLALAYSQWLQVGCLPYFHTWCGLSVNLECRSEMCCTWLAGNRGCQLCWAISLQLRHVSTVGKTAISFPCVLTIWRISATNGWDWLASLRHQHISAGFASWLCYCTSVAQWRSTRLCKMFGHLLGWCTMS